MAARRHLSSRGAERPRSGDRRSGGRPRAPAADDVVEKMRAEELSVAYGAKLAVNQVSLTVSQGEVLALIGPSGCGKTTLLRWLNRLVDLTPTATRGGRILLDGADVDARRDPAAPPGRDGLPAAQPVPDEHLRQRRLRAPRARLEAPPPSGARARGAQGAAAGRPLEEVKDNLAHPALGLSGGQQQRLCIARSLAVRPEVLLLDEPCSALDPISTATIEELIVQLRSEVAIVIVTHNLQQAQRVADRVAFMYLGDLVEYGPAERSSARRRRANPRVRQRRLRLSARRRRSPCRLGGARSLGFAACQSSQDRAPSWQAGRDGAQERGWRSPSAAPTSRWSRHAPLRRQRQRGGASTSRTTPRSATRRPDRRRRPRRQGQARVQERRLRGSSQRCLVPIRGRTHRRLGQRPGPRDGKPSR